MNCQVRRATMDDLPTIYTFELAYIQEIEPDAEACWNNPAHLLYSRHGYFPTHTEGNYRYYKKTLE